MAGGFDIAAALEEARKISAVNAKAIPQLQQLGDLTNQATESLTASILGSNSDGKGNTVLSEQVRMEGELDAQKKKQEMYAAIGMGGEGAAKISTAIALDYNALMTKAQEQVASITQKQQVGLFDDPLQYLWNTITLPDERNAARATINQANLKANQLQTINTLLQDTAQTENAFKATLSSAGQASQLEAMRQEINMRAQRANLEAYASQANTLQSVMQASGAQLRNIAQIQQMQNSAESMAMSRESHAQNRVRFQEWVSDTADKKATQEQILGWYNVGAAKVGMAPIDSMKFKTLIASGVDKETIGAYIEQGYQTSNGGMQGLGHSPSHVKEFLETTKNTLPEKVSYAAEIYQRAAEMSAELVRTGKLNAKDKKAVEAQFDANVQQQMNEYKNKIDYKDGKNPYILPAPSTFETQPEIAKTALYQKVIQAQKMDTSDPTRIFHSGLEAVKAGTISYDEWVKGMTTYYTVGSLANNVQKQFNKYALPNAAEKYPVVIRVVAGVDPTKTSLNPFSRYDNVPVNMMDLAEVNRLAAAAYRAENPANPFNIGSKGK